MSGFTLAPASVDASFRRYFRISWEQQTAIVMDAPPDREDCTPFLDITARLLACEVNVPAVRARNLPAGFLLLDDLGSQLYLDTLTAETADQLYADAIDALLRIQGRAEVHGLPSYDEQLLRQEMSLFRDWLVGRHLQINIDPAMQKMLDDIFLVSINSALEQPQVFVHRDYHSRNLLVTNHANPGILDYQDAVCGPVTYDLVSLLKDCYIKWPREKILDWVQSFRSRGRKLEMAPASPEQFLRWFDLMGVQRHLKASGIFARLLHRDTKTGFIQDIPRTLSYILDLEELYPELLPLAGFIRQRVLPELERRHP